MLCKPMAHCRIPEHTQPIGSIFVRLATNRKCCAHLAHTAKYRSISIRRSDSPQTEHDAHTQRTLQNTYPFPSGGQTRHNQKIMRTRSAHPFPSDGQTRPNQNRMRTLSARCKKSTQFHQTVRLATTRT